MNKVTLIILVVVIIITISVLGILLMRNSEPELNPEITKASTEFKANPGFRQHVAKKLIPHLKIGMTTQEVEALLGEPDRKSEDGLFWKYTLFYSQFIDIRFDDNLKVREIEGCVPTQSDERNKPSGHFKVGPRK